MEGDRYKFRNRENGLQQEDLQHMARAQNTVLPYDKQGLALTISS